MLNFCQMTKAVCDLIRTWQFHRHFDQLARGYGNVVQHFAWFCQLKHCDFPFLQQLIVRWQILESVTKISVMTLIKSSRRQCDRWRKRFKQQAHNVARYNSHIHIHNASSVPRRRCCSQVLGLDLPQHSLVCRARSERPKNLWFSRKQKTWVTDVVIEPQRANGEVRWGRVY